MGSNFQKQLSEFFAPISLTQLNASASFLDRVETKFILTEQEFISILPELKKDYFVLEIAGKTVFEYENIYMDSDDYECYKDYQEWKNTRYKVRTREYTDSGHAFFEYKQKQEDISRKFRYPIDLKDHGKMTKESTKFYEGISMSFNGRNKVAKLSKSLGTEYQRLTLCSKDSSERVTIDFEIKLSSLRGDKKSQKLQNVVIIESKSSHKKSRSHKVMKKHGILQATSCSKYCLGLILTGVFSKKGKLKDTIKAISSMS